MQNPRGKKLTTEIVRKTEVVETMNFGEAMAEVMKLRKITRLEWEDKEIYGVLENGFLMLHDKNGVGAWWISHGDLLGTDYIVV